MSMIEQLSQSEGTEDIEVPRPADLARLDLDGNLSHVFCPKCGARMDLGADKASCRHLVYYFLSECDFLYVREDMKGHMAKIEAASEEDPFVDQVWLLHQLNRTVPIAGMDMELHGLACGPVSFRCALGWDMTPEAADEDEDFDEKADLRQYESLVETPEEAEEYARKEAKRQTGFIIDTTEGSVQVDLTNKKA